MTAEHVTTGVHRVRTAIANAYFVESENGWVLLDAGMPGSATRIRAAARKLFGDTRPQAILLTHGHFDHVGALPRLADEWGTTIYVHPLERPYVTGESSYPPPDPTVGGGLMSLLSPVYPRGPYDFSPRVRLLPERGVVPGLAAWQWVHTPGHSPGHVSFFREADRTLIAGDAVVTTKQEALGWALTERDCVWRPPAYYTVDWEQAAASVRALANLDPAVLATGHGRPLRGAPMRAALHELADRFDEVRPRAGRYVAQPAVADGHGIVSIPPRPPMPASWRIAGALGVAAVAGVVLTRALRHERA